MHFAIGTMNIPKSQAVEHVLSHCQYTTGRATFSNHKVPSWVPDMPLSLRDIKEWAMNRAFHCRELKPDADYFVWMEWGVYEDREDGKYWIIACTYIEDSAWKWHFWYSSHLEVPEKVVKLLFDGSGKDVEEIIEILSWESSVGDKLWAASVWTDGMLSRQVRSIEATQCALAPHFNHFYTL